MSVYIPILRLEIYLGELADGPAFSGQRFTVRMWGVSLGEWFIGALHFKDESNS